MCSQQYQYTILSQFEMMVHTLRSSARAVDKTTLLYIRLVHVYRTKHFWYDTYTITLALVSTGISCLLQKLHSIVHAQVSLHIQSGPCYDKLIDCKLVGALSW